MPQRSAGLLLYRRRGRGVEVLLVHPGGPFWANKDQGAWSIPKGVTTGEEDSLAAAKREFEEETGATAASVMRAAPVALGSFRQSSAKTVDVWVAEGEFDPAGLVSNTFEMEWPPRSGRTIEVHEVDRAQWFAPDEALRKLLKGQRPVLEALLVRLGLRDWRHKLSGGSDAGQRAAKRSGAAARGRPTTSAAYDLFRRAILDEKQVTCLYEGQYRELCPHIIGVSDGEEKVLAFQFGGQTGRGALPRGGAWKCLFLHKVGEPRLREGRWHAGREHKTAQTCVKDIDLDINVHVRRLRRTTD